MKQITVIADDRPGVLAALTRALAEAGVNIESIDGESAATHGVFSITVDLYDHALTALRDSGFQAISEDALLVRLKDESGALARLAERFKDAQLNIRSLRILKRDKSHAFVTLVAEDNELARVLIEDLLVGPSAPSAGS